MMIKAIKLILTVLIGALVLNCILWPILVGILIFLTGSDHAALFHPDSPYARTLWVILQLLFVALCVAIILRQLRQENKKAEDYKTK